MKTLLTASVSILLIISACGIFGDGGGSTTIANVSNLTSSQYSTLNTAATTACTATATSCTPSNIEGRIFMAGAMINQDDTDNGRNNYNMTFLAGGPSLDDVISNPSDPTLPEGVITFDLNESTTVSGKISIPDEETFSGLLTKNIWRIETMFDYIDITLIMPSDADAALASKTYVLRTVFRNTAEASDVTGTMQWGDILLKESGETTFNWCDATSCDNATRPTTPLQNAQIVAASATVADMPGNPNYVGFAIDIDTANQITFTSYDELNCPTCLWTVDYDIANSVKFSAALNTFTTESLLAAGTTLLMSCTYNGCDDPNDDRVKAVLTIGAAGTAPVTALDYRDED